jgi:hypothetical protein
MAGFSSSERIPNAPFVGVSHYGALGDGGSVDETAKLQDALDNEQCVAFGHGPTRRVYATSSPLRPRDGQVLDFTGATIQPWGSSSYPVIRAGGSISTNRKLASDATEFALTVTLDAGSVAALGLAAGDYVRIASKNEARVQVSQVVGIAGEVITVADPLYWPFTVADGAHLAKVTPITLTIRDLTVDGVNNTGAETIGLEILYTLNVTLERLFFKHVLGAGLSAFVGYGMQARGIRTERCGTQALSDVHVYGQTRFQFSDIQSFRAEAFAPGFYGCTAGTIARLSSVGAAGRGFKLQTGAGCILQAFHIDNVPSPGTSLGLVVGCRRNVVQGAMCIGGNTGLWVDGDYNVCTGISARGNANPDVLITSGQDNVIEGDWGTTWDVGRRTRFFRRGAEAYDDIPVVATPGAPQPGRARLYVDASGGKVRLMVRFPSGEAQEIAIEP